VARREALPLERGLAMSEFSVLGRFTTSHLRTEPFPHIHIENAVPEEIANQLLEEYPPQEVLGLRRLQNNARWSYSASKSLQNNAIPEIWRQFVSYHVSTSFWKELVEAFGESLENSLLGAQPTIRDPRAARVGTRGIEDDMAADVFMDAQISGNTPVTRRTSVRGTHVDAGDKLVSGLFYLRNPDDKTEGGNLEIQRWRSVVPRFLKPHLYYEGMRDVVRTHCLIPYRHNSVILFINSLDALHAVTPRAVTSFPRLFLNLAVETVDQRYAVPKVNLLGRGRRKLQSILLSDDIAK